MGYFPDYINHECHATEYIKTGVPNCVGPLGDIIHTWEENKGCIGCQYFTHLHENEEEDEEC